jgi:hypothetical protein
MQTYHLQKYAMRTLGAVLTVRGPFSRGALTVLVYVAFIPILSCIVLAMLCTHVIGSLVGVIRK